MNQAIRIGVVIIALLMASLVAQETEKISPEDLREARIIEAQKSQILAIERYFGQMITRKYNLQPGDTVNWETGEITRKKEENGEKSSE